jgi:hypothetical protein
MEVLILQRKIALDELADTDGSLLSVQHFKGAILIFHSVHHIEREMFLNGLDDGVSLGFLVDEFSLIFRANIKFTAVANDSFFLAIFVACGDLFDGDFVKFNFHRYNE